MLVLLLLPFGHVGGGVVTTRALDVVPHRKCDGLGVGRATAGIVVIVIFVIVVVRVLVLAAVFGLDGSRRLDELSFAFVDGRGCDLGVRIAERLILALTTRRVNALVFFLSFYATGARTLFATT